MNIGYSKNRECTFSIAICNGINTLFNQTVIAPVIDIKYIKILMLPKVL